MKNTKKKLIITLVMCLLLTVLLSNTAAAVQACITNLINEKVVSCYLADTINITDSSHNGLNGTWNSSPSLVSGFYGSAWDFEDGNKNFGVIPNNAMFGDSNNISISAWTNTEDLDGNGDGYGGSVTKTDGTDGWGLRYGNGAADRIAGFYGTGAATSIIHDGSRNHRPGAWEHLILNIEPDLIELYLNNTLLIGASTEVDLSNNEELMIGRLFKSSDAHYYDGLLDEICIFNGTLTPAERLCIYTYEMDFTPPVPATTTFTFINQDPSDIIAFNIMDVGVNITYDITDSDGINTSVLWGKVNNSLTEDVIFINGTSELRYIQHSGTNQSERYQFLLGENKIYPGTYNIPHHSTETEPHLEHTLGTAAAYIKTKFLNITNTKPFSVLEIMANTSGVLDGQVYYCNSSYTAGDPSSIDSCANFANIEPDQDFNHSHNDISFHHFISFSFDTTTKLIGGVYVNNGVGYFLIRGRGGTNKWKVSYIENVSAQGRIQTTSDSGGSWSNFAGTTDAHLHQYSGDDVLYYFIESCDNIADCTNSSVRSDIIALSNSPPTAPDVYSPIEDVYDGIIYINYTASIALDSNISHYNISLRDSSDIFISNINENNSLNLTFNIDSSSLATGSYSIRVAAYADNGLQSHGVSDTFNVDREKPLITPLHPAANDTKIENTGSIVFRTLFTDNNELELFEINITEFITGTNKYSFGNYSLGSISSKEFTRSINTTSWLNTSYIYRARVCDTHTLNDIPSIASIKTYNNLTFGYEDIIFSITPLGSVINSDINKLSDRYTFNFEYIGLSMSKEFLLTGDNIKYLPNSKYKGHFLIGQKMWVDFENDNSVEIKKIDNNTYKVIVYTSNNDVSFNSVGFINCEDLTYSFEIVATSTGVGYTANIIRDTKWFNMDLFDATTTAGMLMYFFMLVILALMVLMGEVLKFPAVVAFAGLGVGFFGFLLYTNVSSIIGLFVIIIGFMYMVSFSRHME